MRRYGILPVVLLLLLLFSLGYAARSAGKPFEITSFPDFSALADEAKKSTVWIRMIGFARDEEGVLVPDGERRVNGSGIVISSSAMIGGGYESEVITNHHVVEDAKIIVVYPFPGGELYRAELVGFDDFLDLALLRVRTPYQLSPASLGDPHSLKSGESAFVIGNPEGYTWSISVGFIGNLWKLKYMIQFDGAINPGNSGGGLFNTKGELIGIPFANSISNSNIGFAISVYMVQKSLPALRKGGRVPHGFLGVTLDDVDDLKEANIARKILQRSLGALIQGIHEGFPADIAGLRVGDIVTEINGQNVLNSDHFQRLIAGSEIGRSIQLKIVRGEEKIILYAVPAERPESLSSIPSPRPGQKLMS